MDACLLNNGGTLISGEGGGEWVGGYDEEGGDINSFHKGKGK